MKLDGDQQLRLYRWERQFVAPLDDSRIHTLEQASSVVYAIWMGEGLLYPPSVGPMPARVAKHIAGLARREQILLRLPAKMITIVHEATHSMLMDVSDEGDPKRIGHGPLFTGLYFKLLEKYVRIPMPVLMHLAHQHQIEFDLTSKPLVTSMFAR